MSGVILKDLFAALLVRRHGEPIFLGRGTISRYLLEAEGTRDAHFFNHGLAVCSREIECHIKVDVRERGLCSGSRWQPLAHQFRV